MSWPMIKLGRIIGCAGLLAAYILWGQQADTGRFAHGLENGFEQSFEQSQAQQNPDIKAPQPTQQLQNTQDLELQAREIGRALRCVVCQNQSIDESDAPLAADMRQIVRSRLEAGESKAQIIAYMRQNYGDYVLLRPPLQKNTALLWSLPFLIVMLALIWFFKPRQSVPALKPSSDLDNHDPDSHSDTDLDITKNADQALRPKPPASEQIPSQQTPSQQTSSEQSSSDLTPSEQRPDS